MKPEIEAILATLGRHAPVDDDERAAVATLTAFLRATPEPLRRSTLEGHVTGSAVVLDATGHALLLLHARLGLWVQPGGHLEPTETDPARAALREATEESGLDDLVLDVDPAGVPLLLDADVHPIPASPKRNEPAHFHHDLCFVARTARRGETRIDPDESHAFRWVGAGDLATLPLDRATLRRLRKVLR